MRPELRPPAARAASCSKASSHCPGKARRSSPLVPAPAFAGINSSGDPGLELVALGPRVSLRSPGTRRSWIPACAGNERRFVRQRRAARFAAALRRILALPTAVPKFHNRATEFHQKESRRVGTRRLPYVGDRVGGLGVRPPALGSVMW